MMQTWRIKNRTKKERPTTQLKGSAIHQFEAMRLTGMRVVHASMNNFCVGGLKRVCSPPPRSLGPPTSSFRLSTPWRVPNLAADIGHKASVCPMSAGSSRPRHARCLSEPPTAEACGSPTS